MISGLFITRTRLAMVVSIVIAIAGAISIFFLPVQQYPEITPPTVSVSCRLSRCQRGGHRGRRRRAARDGDKRRRRHALHVVDEFERRPILALHHFRGRHRPRHCPGQRAEPRATGDFPVARRGAAAGRIGAQPIAGFRAGDRLLFAGRQPRCTGNHQFRHHGHRRFHLARAWSR